MAMPDRIWAAPSPAGGHGVGGWDSTGGLGTPYIRADLVDELVKATEAIRERANEADVKRANTSVEAAMQFYRGRYSGLLEAVEMIDAALARIKGDGK